MKELTTTHRPDFNVMLIPEDVKFLEGVKEELNDTWNKRQIFRTETEMRISVLNDVKFPTNSSKYWQSVREQGVMFENLVTLSFEYRRNDIELEKVVKAKSLAIKNISDFIPNLFKWKS